MYSYAGRSRKEDMKNAKSTMNHHRGFTLVEVMITVAVVSLALFGLLAANTAIQRSNRTSFDRTVALQHANQILERIRDSANTSTNNAVTTYPHGAVIPVPNYTTNVNEQLIGQQVVVTYVDTTTNPLDVTVTVNWQDQGTRAVSTSLRSFVTQRTT